MSAAAPSTSGEAATAILQHLSDIGARVSLPLVGWEGEVPPAPPAVASPPRQLSLILVVPDGGSRMVALESERGQPVAAVKVTMANQKDQVMAAGQAELLLPTETLPAPE